VQALAEEAEQKLQSQDAEGLRTELSAREVDLEALRQQMEDLPKEAEVKALREGLEAAEAKSAALEEETQRVRSELADIQSKVRA
jgi:signal recognition particle GTPase